MNILRNAPLNQAHFHERKAERCLSEGRWDDAIEFYRTAFDFITEAMEKINSQPGLQSLQLQQDFYSRQSRVIEIKRNEQLLAPKFNEDQEKENEDSEEEEGEILTPVVKEVENDSALKTFVTSRCEREPDSLLQFLNPGLDSSSLNQRKYPKRSKDVIEEQRVQIEHLKNLVQTLLEKQELLETEKQSLLERNSCLEIEVSNLKCNLEVGEDLSLDTTETLPEQDFFSFGDPSKASITFQIKNAMLEDVDDNRQPPSLFRLDPIQEEE
ncbi:nuclear receptor-binding factor 2 [Ciona intestinalis]